MVIKAPPRSIQRGDQAGSTDARVRLSRRPAWRDVVATEVLSAGPDDEGSSDE